MGADRESPAITRCPGCGLEAPRSGLPYDRKFHSSAECWALYEKVLAAEYQNGALFGQVHQLTVDAYSVQHAGGRHPDKSVCVHLMGLYFVHEQGVAPPDVPRLLRRLVGRTSWPHLEPPAQRGLLTVGNVAAAGSPDAHVRLVREWAAGVWRAWSPHHGAARALAAELGDGAPRAAR